MLHQLEISSARQRLLAREITSVELVRSCLDRIESVDPQCRAFLHVVAEQALVQAQEADRLLQSSDRNKPLLGIPVAVKDNVAVVGEPLTCASKMLERYRSPYDSTVAEKLKAAGAVLLGRLNMDEFAMGSSTEHSAFFPTRNPWATNRSPGGSSGGAAAAVSSDLCLAAVGSDTGGSIRQPAAFCSCVGLKPSYGRVSRYGLVAFASSLDQIGPLTKSIEDAALMLQVVAGPDSRDSTSEPALVPDYSKQLDRPISGIRIGLPKEYFVKGLDPEVESAVRQAIATYESLGATLREISLPHTEYAVASYYLIATAEASANLARFDGIRYGLRVSGDSPHDLHANTRGQGLGPEVKRRILLGTYALSSGYYDAYYLKAQKVRTLIQQDFRKAWEQVDLILSPTTPFPAFPIGIMTDDPLDMYLSDIYTISANLAGLCAISLPCGFSRDPKLPIGLQLMGKPFDEANLLRVAHAYERNTSWHNDKPDLPSP